MIPTPRAGTGGGVADTAGPDGGGVPGGGVADGGAADATRGTNDLDVPGTRPEAEPVVGRGTSGR